jgi:hypothetical protein
MRAYAVVLAAIVTVFLGYAADLAVSSAGVIRRQTGREFSLIDLVPASSIWYGGTLDPITITARALPAPILVTGLGSKSTDDTTMCRVAPSHHKAVSIHEAKMTQSSAM